MSSLSSTTLNHASNERILRRDGTTSKLYKSRKKAITEPDASPTSPIVIFESQTMLLQAIKMAFEAANPDVTFCRYFLLRPENVDMEKPDARQEFLRKRFKKFVSDFSTAVGIRFSIRGYLENSASYICSQSFLASHKIEGLPYFPCDGRMWLEPIFEDSKSPDIVKVKVTIQHKERHRPFQEWKCKKNNPAPGSSAIQVTRGRNSPPGPASMPSAPAPNGMYRCMRCKTLVLNDSYKNCEPCRAAHAARDQEGRRRRKEQQLLRDANQSSKSLSFGSETESSYYPSSVVSDRSPGIIARRTRSSASSTRSYSLEDSRKTRSVTPFYAGSTSGNGSIINSSPVQLGSIEDSEPLPAPEHIVSERQDCALISPKFRSLVQDKEKENNSEPLLTASSAHPVLANNSTRDIRSPLTNIRLPLSISVNASFMLPPELCIDCVKILEAHGLIISAPLGMYNVKRRYSDEASGPQEKRPRRDDSADF